MLSSVLMQSQCVVSTNKSAQLYLIQNEEIKNLELRHPPSLQQPVYLSKQLLPPQMSLRFSFAFQSHVLLPSGLLHSSTSTSHFLMIYSAEQITIFTTIASFVSDCSQSLLILAAKSAHGYPKGT